jgi:hypothetical protein
VRRNAVGNWVTPASGEVDRGRHDLCGFAAIPSFQRKEDAHLPDLASHSPPAETGAMTDPMTPTDERWLGPSVAESGRPASWPMSATRSPRPCSPTCSPPPWAPPPRPSGSSWASPTGWPQRPGWPAAPSPDPCSPSAWSAGRVPHRHCPVGHPGAAGCGRLRVHHPPRSPSRAP